MITDLNPATYKVPDYILAMADKPAIVMKDNTKRDKNQELILNLIGGVERAADAFMTDHSIRKHGAQELMQPNKWIYDQAGLPGFLVVDALTTAGSYGLSRLLDKEVSPTVGKIFPILAAILEGVVVGRNAIYMNKRGW